MTLAERLSEYVAAAFTGLWIVSHEHEDALAEIARLCHARQWALATWDIDQGLQVGDNAAQETPDPVAAIRAINTLARQDGAALLVLPNFHRLLGGAEIVQALAHQVHRGKQNRTFVVILAPLIALPVELERHFAVLDHDLPDRDQIAEIGRGIATEPGELPDETRCQPLWDAAAGLTRFEAEGAFSLALVRHGRLEADTVWDLKTQALAKSGLLRLHRGGESLDALGGLAALKSFCLKALKPRPPKDPVRPRGILLLGVPGTGKSALAKALGREAGRPTLHLDVGALMGSLVGQTESNVRRALGIADAMAPAILFCDEIEKALAGVASSGQADSGVSARLFGALLTWLNDHTSDVFFVATCNDISRLPPEFSRAERFDGVFFLDLPDADTRQAIWQIHRAAFGVPEDDVLPQDADWTGAEIKACCRLSRLLDVPLVEAARNVVPVAVTASEAVERLRSWAQGRCLSAETPGLYTRCRASGSTRRRVHRPPSAN